VYRWVSVMVVIVGCWTEMSEICALLGCYAAHVGNSLPRILDS